MARGSRLERKREKESLRQAFKYLFLVFVLLFVLIRFGLPALINLAAFLGNLRSSGQPIEQADTLAPPVPQLNSLPTATNSASLALSGTAESGTTVQLFLRGISAEETIADAEGQFQFTNIHLREGENDIYTQARDQAGNTSQASASQTVSLDTKNPELTIDSPKNSDRFFDKDSPITVNGKSEDGVNLTINGRFVLVRSDGSFSTQLNLNGGDNKIEANASDRAGNETKVSLTVNYTP